MNSITVRPELFGQLTKEADHHQKSVEDLVNDWLAEDLWEQRNQKIREESARYQARHAELRAKYADKVIAMRDGKVIDSGDDLLEVYRRTQYKFGDEPVLITYVGDEPLESYTVHSPNLEG